MTSIKEIPKDPFVRIDGPQSSHDFDPRVFGGLDEELSGDEGGNKRNKRNESYHWNQSG